MSLLPSLEVMMGPKNCVKCESVVARSCPTLWNPMHCSLPGSSIHRLLQARILEWISIPFSRGSSQPRDWTRVSHIAGRFSTVWATRETKEKLYKSGSKMLSSKAVADIKEICIKLEQNHFINFKQEKKAGWSTSRNQDFWEKYQ